MIEDELLSRVHSIDRLDWKYSSCWYTGSSRGKLVTYYVSGTVHLKVISENSLHVSISPEKQFPADPSPGMNIWTAHPRRQPVKRVVYATDLEKKEVQAHFLCA